MKIHASARFTNHSMTFHNEIDIELNENTVNIALQKFKIKCVDYFRVNFADMCFFEVYYFDGMKEINLFKKEKQ